MKRNENRRRNARGGFTLIEVMLVVVIIGILAAIALPKFTGQSKKAQIGAARMEIKNIGLSCDRFEVDNGTFPANLQALISQPAGMNNWSGPYLEEFTDPWGREFIYTSPGTHNPKSFDLRSLGPDGVESADDIVNWRENTVSEAAPGGPLP